MTPVKPSLAQHILWRIEALAYDGVTGLARLFPVDRVSDFGAWLFKGLGPMTSTHQVVLTNLRIAFPEASEAEIQHLALESWAETGRVALEFPILDKIIADSSRVEVGTVPGLLKSPAAAKRSCSFPDTFPPWKSCLRP